jgi:biotin operon repressor
MDEQRTFVKLYRSISTWRWYKDGNTFRVFVHLLINANIEPHDFEKITVNRGECATSYKSISLALDISVKNVRTAIEHLKATGEVAATIYPKYQVISILNYDKYQAIPAGLVAGNRQASGRQVAGNRQQLKNIRSKESKNIEANYKAISPPKAPHGFDLFWQAYPKKVGKLDAMRAFAKVSVPAETLIAAVERQKRSVQWSRDNGQYIPNPATWLNQGRWEDEPDGRDTGKVFRQLPAIDC